MASGARKITVEFLGDDKSLSRTATQAEGRMSGLGSKFAKVGKIAALGLAAGTAIAGKALWDVGKAAVEDQKSTVLLANAMQKNAKATKAQLAQTEAWITAQGKAKGVADDQLRPALSNLVRATHDVGKSQKLASLAMDISAATGKPLAAVSLQLSKAYNGNTAGLSRLGIKTKDAQGHAISFKDAQEKLQKTFGGSAAKNADTFGGKMQRLRVMFDEAKESIGYKLLPVAEKLATWFFSKGLPAIQQFAQYLQVKFGPVVAKIADIVGALVPKWVAAFKENLPQIISTLKSAVDILQSLWARFGATITQYVVATLDNVMRVLRGAFNIIAGIFKTVSALLHGDWKGVWDGIQQIVRGAMQVLDGLVRQMFNVLRAVFHLGWDGLKAIVGAAWDGIKNLVADGGRAIYNGVKSIPGKLGALAGSFRTVGTSLINAFIDGIGHAAGFVGKIAGSVWDALKSLINKAIDKINGALDFGINKGPVRINVHAGNIPHLATGGIVKARPGGTLALLGEGGRDEAVIPLGGRNAQAASQTFTVTAPLVIQLDSRTTWQGLLTLKRNLGGVELGLN